MHARHEGVSIIARDVGRAESTVGREFARSGRRGRCVVSLSTIYRAVNCI